MPVFTKISRIFSLVLWSIVIISLTSLLYCFVYGQPDHDIQFYILDAYQMAHGKLPYRDFFDHKPPLFWAILSLGRFLGDSYAAYFSIFALCAGLVHTALFWWTRYYSQHTLGFSDPLSWLSGILAWILSLFGILGLTFNGGTGNGSILIFMSLWSILGVWAFQKGHTRSHVGWLSVSGFCAGLAMLTRLSPVLPTYVGLMLTLDFLRHRISGVRFLKNGGLFLSAMLLPLTTLIPILKYAYQDVVVFNQLYYDLNAILWWKRLIVGTTSMCLSLGPYMIFLGIAFWLLSNRLQILKKTAPLFIYVALELFTSFIQPRIGIYYQYFPIVFPLSLLAAILVLWAFNPLKKQLPLVITLSAGLFFVFFLTHEMRKTLPYLLWNANQHHSRFLDTLSKEIHPKDTFWTLQFYPSAYIQLGIRPASRIHFYAYDLSQAPLNDPPTYVLGHKVQTPNIARWLQEEYVLVDSFEPNLFENSQLIPSQWAHSFSQKTTLYQPQTWVLYKRKKQRA